MSALTMNARVRLFPRTDYVCWSYCSIEGATSGVRDVSVQGLKIFTDKGEQIG